MVYIYTWMYKYMYIYIICRDPHIYTTIFIAALFINSQKMVTTQVSIDQANGYTNVKYI